MSDGAFEMLFKASGVPQVVDAFRTIEQAQSRAEASMLRAAKEGTKVRIAGARAESQSRARASTEESSVVVRESRKRVDVGRSEARERARAAKDAAKEIERAEKQATEATKREAKNRERAEKDLADRRAALAKRLTSGANAVGGAVARGVGNVVNPVLQYGAMAATLGGAFSVAGAVQAARASETSAVALSNSAYNPTSEEGKKRIDPKQLQAAAQAVAVSNGQDTASVLAAWQGYIAKSSDVGSLNEIVGAVASGDQKKIQGSALMKLANLSTASGTGLGDLMGATGALKTQNDKLAPADLVEMMQNVVAQGKLGAVEISDLAKYASVATASSGRLVNGETSQKQAQMAALGLTQVSMKAGSSAADASTGVKNFIADLTNEEKAGGYKKAGVTLRSGDGKLRNINDIIGEMFTAKQGRTELMGAGGLGVGNEGMKVLEGSKSFYDNFLADAEKKGLKGKDAHAYAGKELSKELSKYTTAKYSDKDVADDKQAVMDTADKQFAAAMEEVSIALQKEVTPYIKEFGKHLPELTKTLVGVAKGGGELMKWFFDHPKTGIGAIIAASVAKELATSAISHAAEKGVEKLMERASAALLKQGSEKAADALVARAAGASTVAGTGALTTAGGGAAVGALGVASIMIATAVIGKMMVDNYVDHMNDKQKDAVGLSLGTDQLARDVQNGDAGPEAKAELRKRIDQLKKTADERRSEAADTEGFGYNVARGAAIVTGQGADFEEADKVKRDAARDDAAKLRAEAEKYERMLAALENNTAALKANGGAAAPGAPNRNAPMSAGVRK